MNGWAEWIAISEDESFKNQSSARLVLGSGWIVDRKEAWSHCSRGCEAGGAAAKVNQNKNRDLDDGGGSNVQELCPENGSRETGAISPTRI